MSMLTSTVTSMMYIRTRLNGLGGRLAQCEKLGLISLTRSGLLRWTMHAVPVRLTVHWHVHTSRLTRFCQ